MSLFIIVKNNGIIKLKSVEIGKKLSTLKWIKLKEFVNSKQIDCDWRCWKQFTWMKIFFKWIRMIKIIGIIQIQTVDSLEMDFECAWQWYKHVLTRWMHFDVPAISSSSCWNESVVSLVNVVMRCDVGNEE